MPQSLAQIIVHIVFSTKGREPFLKDRKVRGELHSYLGGICNNHESPSVVIGGYIDHVHVVCRLSKTVAIDQLVRELKVQSSKWLKTKGEDFTRFHWQAGYGAFSVSPSHREPLIKYVHEQESHHRSVSYQDELIRILYKYQVTYDERYLWD